MLLAAKSNKFSGFNSEKKFLFLQQSLNQLKNAGSHRKGVSPSTVYVSSPNVKSERKYEEKRIIFPFVSLQSCPDYP